MPPRASPMGAWLTRPSTRADWVAPAPSHRDGSVGGWGFAPTPNPKPPCLGGGLASIPVRSKMLTVSSILCNYKYIFINIYSTFPILCVHSKEVPHGLGQAN